MERYRQMINAVLRTAVCISVLTWQLACDSRLPVEENLPPAFTGRAQIRLGQSEDSVARITGIAHTETYDTDADNIYRLAIDSSLFESCMLFVRNGRVYSIHLERASVRPSVAERLHDSLRVVCRNFYGTTFRTSTKRTDTLVAVTAEATTPRGATLWVSYTLRPSDSFLSFVLADYRFTD